jgi:hypothetical protein
VPRAQRARLRGRATNSAEPLEYHGLEYAALPVLLNPIAVWALSVPNNAGRFFFDAALYPSECS